MLLHTLNVHFKIFRIIFVRASFSLSHRRFFNNISHSFWISFCLQTNYMQSITFILIAIRRWLLWFRFVCCVFSWVLSLTFEIVSLRIIMMIRKSSLKKHNTKICTLTSFSLTENRICKFCKFTTLFFTIFVKLILDKAYFCLEQCFNNLPAL